MNINRTIEVTTFQTLHGWRKLLACVLTVALTVGAFWAWTELHKPRHKPALAPIENLPYEHNGAFNLPDMIQTQRITFPADSPVARLVATNTLINGVYKKCSPKVFLLVPYFDCTIMLQPGTTHALKLWDDAHPNGTEMAAVTAWTSLCTPVMGAWAILCAPLGWYFATVIDGTVRAADRTGQCARFRFDVWPEYNMALNNFRADVYGQPERWLIAWINGQDFYYWGYPTSCLMYRPCPPVGPGTCVV